MFLVYFAVCNYSQFVCIVIHLLCISPCNFLQCLKWKAAHLERPVSEMYSTFVVLQMFAAKATTSHSIAHSPV